MRSQPRPPAAPNRDLREDRIEHPMESRFIEDPSIENPFLEDDPFVPMPSALCRSTATAMPESALSDETVHADTVHADTVHADTVHADTVHADTVHADTVHADTVHADAMQESLLSVSSHAPELDGLEELGPQLAWVSLDAPRGLLVCKNLDVEVCEFVGTIVESRVVRVMKDNDEKDRNGGVFCASSNRQIADVGRPGRECGSCEDRKGCCFPRWWIAWREEESGQTFAHTLSQAGTMNFTRYAAKLRREGHVPSDVVTRIFVEEARRQNAATLYRRLQFEQEDPFRDQ
ncbi:MAG: hypothetical protein ACRYFS_19865 [Janthinobacterium lividum]